MSFVPLVTIVDEPALETTVREIAAGIHEQRDVPRTVCTQLTAEEPLVGIIE